MAIFTWLLRLLSLWALAFWLGGFTFYSSVVIPVLHDQLGSPLETGLITKRVTDSLNLLGVATIVLGWLTILCQPATQKSGRHRRSWSTLLLAVTTVCLVLLMALHRVLDQRLDAGLMHGFYNLHRLYLWVSMVQWVANLALLTCWAFVGRTQLPEILPENSQVSGFSRMPEIPT